MLHTMPRGGGQFAERGRGLEAAPHYRPRPLCSHNAKKAKSKPCAQSKTEGMPGKAGSPRREPWEQGSTPRIAGETLEATQHPEIRSRPWVRSTTGCTEGGDRLSPGSQLAMPAPGSSGLAGGIMVQERAGGRDTPKQSPPWWEGAQAGGKGSRRLLGGRSGHGSNPRPGTPVPLQTVSQVPKCLWRC